MQGEPVTVRWRTSQTTDEMGCAIWGYTEEETVQNVLVNPEAAADELSQNTPYGVRVAYSLAFPKTWSKPLKNAEIKLGGEWLIVIGDPKPSPPDKTPTAWNYTAKVAVVDG